MLNDDLTRKCILSKNILDSLGPVFIDFTNNSPIYKNKKIRDISQFSKENSNLIINPNHETSPKSEIDPKIKLTPNSNSIEENNAYLTHQGNSNENEDSNPDPTTSLDSNLKSDPKSDINPNQKSTSTPNPTQENKEKIDESINIISFFEELCKYYDSFLRKSALKTVFEIFKKKHEIENDPTKDLKEIKDYVGESHFLFNELLSIFFDELFDQKIIESLFQKYTTNVDLIKIDNYVTNCGDPNSTYEVYFDRRCYFYVMKKYCNNNEAEIKKEFNILNTNFNQNENSFIVHLSNMHDIISKKNDNNDDNDDNNLAINKEGSKTICFPLYTNLTLTKFIDSQHDEFNYRKNYLSIEDKLVMIYEIAIALCELYAKGKSHKNLCGTSIFIDSRLNAYLCNFYSDTTVETNLTKLAYTNYFRHPDLITIKDGSNNNDDDSDNNDDDSDNNDDDSDNNDDDGDNNDDDSNIDDDGDNNDDIRYDIYSFGVLLYFIVTENDPKKGFSDNNTVRKDIINTLKSGYIDYLFGKYNDKDNDFDKVYKIDGIREFIEKCMKGEEFKTFGDIIEYLKTNFIDKSANKNEIYYRVKQANRPETFKCTLSEIVFNLFNNQNSLSLLNNFVRRCMIIENGNLDDSIFENKDIATVLLEFLGFKNIGFDQNDKIHFDEYFDLIIRENVFSKTKERFFSTVKDRQLKLNDNDQKMMQLSINTSFNIKNKNKNEECINISNYLYTIPNLNDTSMIFPITTLNEFINNIEQIYSSNNNQNNLIEIILLYSYNLSKEVQMIHSYGLYHGEINEESIGIYYNSKEQIFIPSILLYYYYYQINKELKKKKKTKPTDYEEYISQKQKKDVSKLLKIIKKLDPDTQIIPNEIYKCDSISDVVSILYNTIISYISNIEKNEYIEENEKLRLSNRIKEIEDYSLYQLTFRNLANIYFQYKISEENYENIKKYQEIETNAKTFIDICKTFKEILIFSNELLDIQNSSDETTDNNENDNTTKEQKILNKIHQNNEDINDIYYMDTKQMKINPIKMIDDNIRNTTSIQSDVKRIEIKESINRIHVTNSNVVNFYLFKKNESFERNERIIHKEVFRKLEIKYCDDNIIYFLILRYIRDLYPLSNFRIKLIIETERPYDYNKIKDLLNANGYKSGFEKESSSSDKEFFFIHVDNIGPARTITGEPQKK